MSQPAAGNGNNNNAASSTSAVASSSIPQNAAAGGITITQPAQTAQASYYKIASGVPVTFGWNFTSILQYPSSLYVYAYCSENSNSYPIAASPSNGLPGRATQVVWDPYSYSMTAQNSNLPQLIQATYRLKIFDERGENVGATGGLFQPNSKVEFALYIPSSYTPLAGEYFEIQRRFGGGEMRKRTHGKGRVWIYPLPHHSKGSSLLLYLRPSDALDASILRKKNLK